MNTFIHSSLKYKTISNNHRNKKCYDNVEHVNVYIKLFQINKQITLKFS